jgi:cytochrome c biogenesis protein CcmG, thiol:disulfide interchange protein DsbE
MTRRRGSPVAVAALVAACALLALLAYGVLAQRPARGLDAALAAGKRPAAPELVLPRLDGGRRVSLRSWRGSVVVLNYWASWCTPCRDESPLLARWQRRIAARGATVVGVDVLDVTADAHAFVRRYRLDYPMLRDADGDSQRRFGVTGYPETLVIDKQGRVAALRRGPVDDAFLTRSVLPLLGRRA